MSTEAFPCFTKYKSLKIRKVHIFKGAYKNDVIQFWQCFWDPQKVLLLNLIIRERIIHEKKLKKMASKRKLTILVDIRSHGGLRPIICRTRKS